MPDRDNCCPSSPRVPTAQIDCPPPGQASGTHWSSYAAGRLYIPKRHRQRARPGCHAMNAMPATGRATNWGRCQGRLPVRDRLTPQFASLRCGDDDEGLFNICPPRPWIPRSSEAKHRARDSSSNHHRLCLGPIQRPRAWPALWTTHRLLVDCSTVASAGG